MNAYWSDLALCALGIAVCAYLGFRKPRGNRYKRNRLWRDAVLPPPKPDDRDVMRKHWEMLDRKTFR